MYGFGESNGDVFEVYMDDCYGMYYVICFIVYFEYY